MNENTSQQESIPVADAVWTPVRPVSPLPPPPPMYTPQTGSLPPSSPPPSPPHGQGKRAGVGLALVAFVAVVSAIAGSVAGVLITDNRNNGTVVSAPVVTAPQADDSVATTQTQIAKVAAAVAPSVVTISAQIDAGMESGGSVGTGIFLTSDGEILTNAHVVDGATKLQVRMSNETEPREGRVLAVDAGNDLALVKIEGTGFTAGTFADPKSIRLGDPVIAIGYALNLDGGPSVTTGIVSALNRTITTESGALNGLLQTDAAISSGNSGGPLVNFNAQVVGINTAVARGDNSTAANNIGFAISTKEVLRVIELLRKQASGEERKEGYLGVGLNDRTDGGQGAVIANVQPDSPAAKAGVQEGDVVLAINDEPIAGRAGMIAIVRDALPGETITMKLERGKEILTVTATLVERDTANG